MMPSRTWMRGTLSTLALANLACFEPSPVAPSAAPSSVAVPLLALIVSDPSYAALAASSTTTGSSNTSTADVEVTYVSLPAQTLPSAINVRIRNVTTGGGWSAPTPFTDGGFDPVVIVARANDELELSVTSHGGTVSTYRAVVPKRRPPKVVRSSPPKGMVDVPLNSVITVVFTEPIAPSTLTTATVQLVKAGVPVSGIVRLVAGSLFAAEFVPENDLASGTTYDLVVTGGILDADGDALETEFSTSFKTAGNPTVPEYGDVRFASISFRVTNHACGLDTTGLAYCWGDNHAGALGTGIDPWYSDTPVLVGGAARHFTSLSSGYYATCAIEAATSLAYCWGYNSVGDLGDGTLTTRWFPTLVAEGKMRFSDITASGGVTCGIEAQTGLAHCWGAGGATGDGTLAQRSSPAPVSSSVRFSSISTSGPYTRGTWRNSYYTCALEAETGFGYCWGSNEFGQLGDGTTTDRLVPTPVGGGLRFRSIVAGDAITCGIQLQTDFLYCWGANEFGQLRDGTTSPRKLPALVGGGDRRFTSVSAGDLMCGVETTTDAAYCWGLDHPQPVVIAAGTIRFSSITAATGKACGVESVTGRGYCWDFTSMVPTLLSSNAAAP